ncbi:MAG: class I SAM-dependent methyltransferase [Desulfobacteraceae bacterium]|nr:class I SAM-dependent methyltransferase [Desulfobacteraceae bacterium]MBU4001533.1 class I SAM-dependent methyltransferase [Pseudomonadota bacterium]MBU4054081.1 class I SAM-dependent methyltransferase [Pseudomonadota bacterium]
MGFFNRIFDRKRLVFQWRYFRKQTPWDTRVTPPEVIEFLEQAKAGRALDLGCGTGTNAMAMARRGWTVTGVDFSSRAIGMAKHKASEEGLKIDYYAADVTDLGFLKDPYDYVLDIGCLFTLNREKRLKYAQHLERLMKPQGIFMLYAWLHRELNGRPSGISIEEVQSLLEPWFLRKRLVIGEEKGFGSAWYWYERK